MTRFLLDECVSGAVGTAAADWNAGPANPPVDVLQVGQPPDLPRGSKDPDVLRWAERNGRVVVTNDRKTMPGHLAAHLAAGGHLPGLFCIRPSTSPAELVAELAMFAFAGDPTHYVDTVTFIPL